MISIVELTFEVYFHNEFEHFSNRHNVETEL